MLKCPTCGGVAFTQHKPFISPPDVDIVMRCEACGALVAQDTFTSAVRLVTTDDEPTGKTVMPSRGIDRTLAGRRPWIQLLPGVYDDQRGGLHIVMTEFLAGNGYVDTPENRATLLQAVRDRFPGAVVDEDLHGES